MPPGSRRGLVCWVPVRRVVEVWYIGSRKKDGPGSSLTCFCGLPVGKLRISVVVEDWERKMGRDSMRKQKKECGSNE